MEHYSLFLDEIHAGGHFDHFCLAGIIVKTEDYQKQIIPAVEQLKQDLFGNTSVILHEMDIQSRKTGTPYEIFQNIDTRQKFWEDIKNILLGSDIKGLAVGVHEQDIINIYRGVRDKYFLSLQLILENFTQFLECVNGKGDIFVESSNPLPYKNDDQLQHHFYDLKANGTLFYDKRTVQQRIGTISFPLKADNIIGLQLADLIPNSLNRKLSGKRLRTFGLIDAFEKIAYDGSCGKQDRFGIKLIP